MEELWCCFGSFDLSILWGSVANLALNLESSDPSNAKTLSNIEMNCPIIHTYIFNLWISV